MRLLLIPAVCALIWTNHAEAADSLDPLLQQAIAGAHRSQEFVARDGARHPGEELAFFGIKPSSTVIEIWPGGGYWTEILAPYLHDHGIYYAAVPPVGPNPTARAVPAYNQKLESNPAIYDKVRITMFGKDHYDITPPPPGSADFVLTFRNFHDWMPAGYAEQSLTAFYEALKPGGILGIEDHRGRTDQAQDTNAKTGYVRQDYMIEQARKAGFEFVGASEVNANPRDTKDWPEGIWTLPPTYRLGELDKAKYAAIGEGDNFVLKFRKPAR